MLSNPNTAGTAKLLINTMVQMKGHDEAMEYFKALDKNISQYTKSGSGPSKMVGPGECVIGIGFLHDGIYQILQGYDNIQLIVPEDGTSFEVGATASTDAHIQTQPSCGLNTPCLLTVWTTPRRMAPISSWY